MRSIFEQTVNGGGMRLDTRMEGLSEFRLLQNDRQRSPLQLLPDLHQGRDRFIVEGARGRPRSQWASG